MLNNLTDKIHDFFHKRPVLVLVIELLFVALWAFALCIPAIIGDAEVIRITGYMDTELWYATFGILAIFVSCVDGVFLSFDEYRKRKTEKEKTDGKGKEA